MMKGDNSEERLVKRETLLSLKQMILRACVIVLCGAAFSGQAEPLGEHLWTGNISIGYQQWTALADLDTEKFGTFEEGGFNLSASGHGRWKYWNRSTILLGADLGLMINDSNIRAPGDSGTLSADILFITPSIRWTFGKPHSLRINLESGLGLYWASIREFISTDYGALEGTRHFDEIAPGGYVGTSFDIPLGKMRRWHMNFGGRVHYADFGTVNVIGRNSGELDGPIISVQLGFSYYR